MSLKRDRSLFRFPLQETKYLIFKFFPSGVKAKRGVEFHRSTRNASRITTVKNNIKTNTIETVLQQITKWYTFSI